MNAFERRRTKEFGQQIYGGSSHAYSFSLPGRESAQWDRDGLGTGWTNLLRRCPPMQTLNYGEEKWRALARHALEEQDHEKMLMLVQQIIDAYREQRPTSHRTVQ